VKDREEKKRIREAKKKTAEQPSLSEHLAAAVPCQFASISVRFDNYGLLTYFFFLSDVCESYFFFFEYL